MGDRKKEKYNPNNSIEITTVYVAEMLIKRQDTLSDIINTTKRD